jgi:hypothetical protein
MFYSERRKSRTIRRGVSGKVLKKSERGGRRGGERFEKKKKNEKRSRKSEKHVDTGGEAWYYIQALERRGLRERGPGSAGILKTIQRRERNDS